MLQPLARKAHAQNRLRDDVSSNLVLGSLDARMQASACQILALYVLALLLAVLSTYALLSLVLVPHEIITWRELLQLLTFVCAAALPSVCAHATH